MISRARHLKVLFWFWPFLAFLFALRHVRLREYHIVLLMFSFVYGYTVFMSPGDVVRLDSSFNAICNATFTDYVAIVKQSYMGKEYSFGRYGVVTTQPDIYAVSLQFIVSRVTDNSRWFFAVVSLVFFYIFLNFLNDSLTEVKWTGAIWQKIFFVCLLCMVPFYYPVTGIRFWIAMYVYLFFTIRYIKQPRFKYVIWATTSVFFHFALVLPVFLLYLHVGKVNRNRFLSRTLVLVSLVFFMLTTSEQIAGHFDEISDFFEGTRIEDRIDNYSDYDYILKKTGGAGVVRWYARWDKKAFPLFFVILFVLEYAVRPNFRTTKFVEKLHRLNLLFFVLTLFTLNLGPIGRYHYIFDVLSALRLVILMGLNPKNQFLRFSAVAITPILLLHLAVVARAGFYSVDPFLLIPSFSFFFWQSDISLSELLVGH